MWSSQKIIILFELWQKLWNGASLNQRFFPPQNQRNFWARIRPSFEIWCTFGRKFDKNRQIDAQFLASTSKSNWLKNAWIARNLRRCSIAWKFRTLALKGPKIKNQNRLPSAFDPLERAKRPLFRRTSTPKIKITSKNLDPTFMQKPSIHDFCVQTQNREQHQHFHYLVQKWAFIKL